jgi:hypothetical protein
LPGATTRVTTGDETGVTKAAEAAIATTMASGYGDTSSTAAARQPGTPAR